MHHGLKSMIKHMHHGLKSMIKHMHHGLKSMIKHMHHGLKSTRTSHLNAYVKTDILKYTLKRDGERIQCDFHISEYSTNSTREGRISFERDDLPMDLITHPYEYLHNLTSGFGV